MYIFIIIIFVLCIIAGVMGREAQCASLNKRLNRYLVASFIIIMFLYLFKDNSIFPDLPEYFTLFHNSNLVKWENIQELSHYTYTEKYEIGWCVLTKALSSVSSSELSLVFVVGCIILLGYWRVFQKHSNLLWMAVVLFFLMRFYNSCFVLRQNLAVAICLFSIPYIEKRKPLQFFSIILVAWSIHQTALIFSILYPLYSIKINKRYLLIYGVSLAVAYRLTFYLNNYVMAYFSFYESYLVDERTSSGSNLTSLFISSSVIGFTYLQNRNKEQTQFENLIFHGLILAWSISLLKIGLPGTVGRLGNYFAIFTMLALPNACNNIRNNSSIKAGSILMILLMYFYLAVQTMNYDFKLVF